LDLVGWGQLKHILKDLKTFVFLFDLCILFPDMFPAFNFVPFTPPKANPQLIARTIRAIFVILWTVVFFVSASYSIKTPL
jgi:hypothetical protein